MIVELCGIDLLKLVNGEQVVVGDLIVRTTEADASNFNAEGGKGHQLGGMLNSERQPNTANRSAQQIRASRRSARAKVVGKANKTGQRWMRAIFDGHCYFPNCRKKILKGELIVYDYDQRRSLCEAHGEQAFPALVKPEEVTT